MGIHSGKGDGGVTGLPFRQSIHKDSPVMRAIGDLDELNAFLGLAKSGTRSRADRKTVESMQRDISRISSEIAVGSANRKKFGSLIAKEDVDRVRKMLYGLEEKARPRDRFYLPGDGRLSALYDVARAVARRAERSVAGLFKGRKARCGEILAYLNCVSDVLFLMARKCAGRK